MINEHQSFRECLIEAFHRIDGQVMIFCSAISIALVVISIPEILGVTPSSRLGKMWSFWFFMPLIQFLYYIRFRQYDFGNKGSSQIITAIQLAAIFIIAVVAFY